MDQGSLKLKAKKQVAALPVLFTPDGAIRVLLITSRETRRFIVPKGWPMKGRKDHRAAAIEAKQEAGVTGRIHRKPIGSYTAWKRQDGHFDLCEVQVYVLEVDRQLTDWREKAQRRRAWLPVDDAIELVDEPGLVTSLQALPVLLGGRRSRNKRAVLHAAILDE